ncbi:MAG TPA: hypothetical protein VFY13_03125, partial [Luteolibacter sp.]|nr:hypothetical protein [Luteolibacter sp.]
MRFSFKRLLLPGILLLGASVFGVISCFRGEDQRHQGWVSLRWVEKPSAHGPSREADPADRTRFLPLTSYDLGHPETFATHKAMLREGDVIAYWMKKKEASQAVSKGDLNKVGYGVLSYGHLAIVAADPADPKRLVLFSSQSFKGPNTEEGIDTLAAHSWDAYRLDQWDRVDKARFHEFISLSKQKAGNWKGYDFSGMFGLWNSNLQPDSPEAIGHDYICSTIVVAALHYSGLKLDA